MLPFTKLPSHRILAMFRVNARLHIGRLNSSRTQGTR
jgi:hypothetical protein